LNRVNNFSASNWRRNLKCKKRGECVHDPFTPDPSWSVRSGVSGWIGERRVKSAGRRWRARPSVSVDELYAGISLDEAETAALDRVPDRFELGVGQRTLGAGERGIAEIDGELEGAAEDAQRLFWVLGADVTRAGRAV
jgi:hypothetical protein